MFLAATILSLCLAVNDPGKYPGTYQDLALALNPTCWLNWGIYDEQNLQDPRFTPMLWKLNEASIKQASDYAAKYPGRTWLLYNEPEGLDQSNTTPASAAFYFDKAFTLIKNLDPTAKIACCGNMVREESIDWLNEFVRLAKFKPDYWHVHIYIADDEPKSWVAFWNYWDFWNVKSFGSLPTLITETCSVSGGNQLFNFLLNYRNPKILNIYWFSAFPEPQVADWQCNLFDAAGKETLLAKSIPSNITPSPEPPRPIFTPSSTKTPTQLPTDTPTQLPTDTPTQVVTKTPTPIPTPSPTSTPTSTLLGSPTGEKEKEEPNLYRVYLSYVTQ